MIKILSLLLLVCGVFTSSVAQHKYKSVNNDFEIIFPVKTSSESYDTISLNSYNIPRCNVLALGNGEGQNLIYMVEVLDFNGVDEIDFVSVENYVKERIPYSFKKAKDIKDGTYEKLMIFKEKSSIAYAFIQIAWSKNKFYLVASHELNSMFKGNSTYNNTTRDYFKSLKFHSD